MVIMTVMTVASAVFIVLKLRIRTWLRDNLIRKYIRKQSIAVIRGTIIKIIVVQFLNGKTV